MSILEKTINQLSRLLKSKEIGVAELTREYISAIEQKNPKVNCYVTVCEKKAAKQAEAAQKRIDSGERVPVLCGIPMGIKDNICTAGERTTCASRMLEHFIPPYSSTAFKNLEDDGVVLLGKHNMDEFGMGSSSENSIFGPAHNPWNIDCVAGGSSGGSAAAVAANLAAFALGTDTGGSIRQPASFCGVVGLKPTYGLVSRYGLISFASSLDQIGALTKDVTDCAIVLNAIAGQDPLDSTSVGKQEKDYLEGIGNGVAGIKIGLPKELLDLPLDSDVMSLLAKTINGLERMGATSFETALPSVKYISPAYYFISSAEASSNLGRFDGIRYGYRNKEAGTLPELYRLSRAEGFGRGVKRRILLGTYALSEGYQNELYNKALKARRMITDDFNRLLEEFDVIVTPVYPTTAFRIGRKLEDPSEVYSSDKYAAGVNLAGLPAISVPCGFGKNGMPVGIQLIGKRFSEKLLLRVAHAVEKAVGPVNRQQTEGA